MTYKTDVNEHGNIVRRYRQEADRYLYDFELCTPEKGWQQYDTEQDAWYFGVWVNRGNRRILTYAEGDVTLVECPTEEGFQAELAAMAKFYGPPPPAFTVVDPETGTVTEHYAQRPGG